ncbi:helix-turn-helix domain-containing protein [Actinomadura sp. LD22]|uniref:Helix-turn-helix domain-containing protein n=1 Tax=Actinomadura physcomitrii TaxID=2650748 RepID=A0A6I4MYE2_9ACTN|nr:helix-turn-helix domain-containing protein [Actinomadura physcomitrii]MWA07366.1 helix-turn-helix domain-containing protein [Actinomadura physcomitrii]
MQEPGHTQEWSSTAPIKTRDGNQTLARGLKALLAVVDSKDGLSVQEVGELLGVHRSIAYRMLQTLVDFGLAARRSNGVYIPGARLATLAQAYQPELRDVSGPVMRELADRLQTTVSLFVEEGDTAVAIAMVEPMTSSHHLAFKPGMRTPLMRGAAGYAILAGGPPTPGEPEAVILAREVGYARSHAEIEAGQYAVAAWIPSTRACLNLISYRQDIIDGAGPAMRRAADKVGRLLRRKE